MCRNGSRLLQAGGQVSIGYVRSLPFLAQLILFLAPFHHCVDEILMSNACKRVPVSGRCGRPSLACAGWKTPPTSSTQILHWLFARRRHGKGATAKTTPSPVPPSSLTHTRCEERMTHARTLREGHIDTKNVWCTLILPKKRIHDTSCQPDVPTTSVPISNSVKSRLSDDQYSQMSWQCHGWIRKHAANPGIHHFPFGQRAFQPKEVSRPEKLAPNVPKCCC